MNSIDIEGMILYEDREIIVCHKPAGFPVQSRGIGSMDMESALRNYLVKKGEKPYIAIIHRLDQPVQGVLVFAKNKESAASLNRQMQQGKIEKYYLAYAEGKIEKKSGCLINEMEKDTRSNTSKIAERKTPGSKTAKLEYKVLKETEEGSLLEIRLHTGRHHQIRVQMAYAGLPLFGDAKYNSGKVEAGSGKNLALCAYRLSFIHPRTKKKMEFKVKPVGNFPIV